MALERSPYLSLTHSNTNDSPSMMTIAPRMRSPGPQLCFMLLQATLLPVILREATWVSLAPPLLRPQLARSQVSLLFLDWKEANSS